MQLASAETKPFVLETELVNTPDASSLTVRALNLVLVAGLCLVLAFGPLAFGAVQEWAITVLELGSALLVVIWALRETARRRMQIIPSPLFLPALLFAGIVVIQLVFRTSAYWYATWFAAFQWMAYGLLLFVATQTLRRTRWLRVFAIFFTIYGFLVAVFAIAQYFTSGIGKVYWVIPLRNGGWVFGPYINHAHYAGLMELLVPIPLVFFLGHFYRRTLRMLFGFAALIMGSTIFLSRSLGGMVAFVAQLILLAVLAASSRSGKRSRWKLLIPLGLLCVLLIAFLVALQDTGLGDRIANILQPFGKGDAAVRVAIVRDGFKMVRDRFVLGWGLGTFPAVYPSYRTFYSDLLVNEAHNDFLQVFAESGALGFATMIAFLVLLYRTGLQRLEHWSRELRGGMILAAIVGCTGMLVHGLCDFNLQIPANAAIFFTLAAIAAANHSVLTNRMPQTKD
jgi:O-antigen ligase